MKRLTVLLALSFSAISCCPAAQPWDNDCNVEVVRWEVITQQCAYRDEPYWRCDATWCDVNSLYPPPGVDVAQKSRELDAMIADPNQLNPNGCSWINFSYPEVRWLNAGTLHPRWTLKPNRISFDRYKGACGWDETEMYAAELKLVAQQYGSELAIVVENNPDVISLARHWLCKNGGGKVIVWPYGT